MKIISEEQIRQLNLAPNTFLEWVEDALIQKASAILPPKISMKPQEEIFYNIMPSIVGNVGGVKIVSRYPDRNPTLQSKIVLFNTDNGNFEALIDANYITTMRTAAVAVNSIKLFARKDFETVGVIGLGEIGTSTLKMFLQTFESKKMKIKIYNYKNRGEEAIKPFNNFKNVNFILCETVEDVIKDSDVIISAPTYVKDDFCGDDCYKKGVLVVPIHTRGFMNCDLFFDKIYGDDYGHLCGFKYFDKYKFFAETADVIKGKVKGRESQNERILAYNIGISLHDIYFAQQILNLCKNKE